MTKRLTERMRVSDNNSRIGYGILPAEVLSAVNDERMYQNLKWGTVKEHPHEVGAWLTILRIHLTDAEREWPSKRGDIGALEEIRKIAAIAFACMENCGVIHRQPAGIKTDQSGSPMKGNT